MSFINDTFKEIKAFSIAIKNNRFLKTLVTIIAIIILIMLGLVIYYFSNSENYDSKPFYENYLFYLSIIFGYLIGSLIFDPLNNFQENTKKDLVRLQVEKVQITQKIETENKLDIFHTIQLSLNELNQYYTINKGQARSSFRWSIFAIVTGFLTIVFGVWLHYFQNKVELSYLAGASGVILEFIGGAYFFVYKKSLEQVNFFFGQLIKIQDTMLAINIANNITIDDKKVDMHEKIIVSLLERSLK